MDTGTIIFGLFLLMVGLKLVSFVRSELAREEQPVNDDQALRQQTARAQRQMEWQRGRIWWKMDEAYAEFVRKAATETSQARLLPEKVLPRAKIEKPANTGEEDFALLELQTAYEVFLDKNSRLTAAAASYAHTPAKPFEPHAG